VTADAADLRSSLDAVLAGAGAPALEVTADFMMRFGLRTDGQAYLRVASLVRACEAGRR
jgi:hypothetical protein